MKQWGSEAVMAGQKEAGQLHWRDTFVPKVWNDLSAEQKGKILGSHMFVERKRSVETKARLIGGGDKQQEYLTKEDSSSPTASTEAILLTSIVDASKKRDVAIIDIPNEFIQTRVEREKD